MILARLLKILIHVGCLNIGDATGRNYRFEGRHKGPEITVRLHNRVYIGNCSLIPPSTWVRP